MRIRPRTTRMELPNLQRVVDRELARRWWRHSIGQGRHGKPVDLPSRYSERPWKNRGSNTQMLGPAIVARVSTASRRFGCRLILFTLASTSTPSPRKGNADASKLQGWPSSSRVSCWIRARRPVRLTPFGNPVYSRAETFGSPVAMSPSFAAASHGPSSSDSASRTAGPNQRSIKPLTSSWMTPQRPPCAPASSSVSTRAERISRSVIASPRRHPTALQRRPRSVVHAKGCAR